MQVQRTSREKLCNDAGPSGCMTIVYLVAARSMVKHTGSSVRRTCNRTTSTTTRWRLLILEVTKYKVSSLVKGDRVFLFHPLQVEPSTEDGYTTETHVWMRSARGELERGTSYCILPCCPWCIILWWTCTRSTPYDQILFFNDAL